HVTGIVNVGGYMEYLVLQNTRLSVVAKMAEVISKALSQVARDFAQMSQETPDNTGTLSTTCD
ncbi:MAG: DUF1256 domain-containing protein, partial [Bacillota bacterium]